MTSNPNSTPRAAGQFDHPADRFLPATDEPDRNKETGQYSAARAIGETLSTTFGPNGLDKMLVDRSGTVVVSNTGSTVLDGLEIDAPTGRVIRNAVKAQTSRIGDGSTTMALLVGELLTAASDLIDSGVHPMSVVDGYLTAGRLAADHVSASSMSISRGETTRLSNIATTAITGRWDADAARQLGRIAVEALEQVGFDAARLTLHAYPGGGVTDTEHVDGILVDADISSTDINAKAQTVTHGIPRVLSDPSVALVDGEISPTEVGAPATVSVSDANELDRVYEYERQQSDSLVKPVLSAEADVVVCQQAINDEIRTALTRHGVLPVERTRRDEFNAIARATGAEVVTKPSDIRPGALGKAGEFCRRSFGPTSVLTITGLPRETHASVVLRGGTEHVAEETRRIIDDCIQNLRQAVHGGGVVPGGGATWLSAALHITDHAPSIDDRSQLAVTKFADAMEVVPRTLARNAGSDPIETLSTMRTRHKAGDSEVGVDLSGSVRNMTASGVIEPAAVVSGCLTTAVESAVTLLRIDDIHDAGGEDKADVLSHSRGHDHGDSHGSTGGHDHGAGGHSGYPWALSH